MKRHQARGRHLRDTGLLHALLRIPDADALLSHPQMGASWEAMVVEEIIRQFNALGESCEYSYYRTGGGAQADHGFCSCSSAARVACSVASS